MPSINSIDSRVGTIEPGATGIKRSADVTTQKAAPAAVTYDPHSRRVVFNSGRVQVAQETKPVSNPLAPVQTPEGQMEKTGSNIEKNSATLPEVPIIPPSYRPGALVNTGSFVDERA